MSGVETGGWRTRKFRKGAGLARAGRGRMVRNGGMSKERFFFRFFFSGLFLRLIACPRGIALTKLSPVHVSMFEDVPSCPMIV